MAAPRPCSPAWPAACWPASAWAMTASTWKRRGATAYRSAPRPTCWTTASPIWPSDWCWPRRGAFPAPTATCRRAVGPTAPTRWRRASAASGSASSAWAASAAPSRAAPPVSTWRCATTAAPKPGADMPFEPDLPALARWADFLVLSCPGGPATRHLVSAAVLDALGPDGFLINVARGSVVDEAALIRAIETDRIAGAGLDVYADEPRVPAALLGRDNVVVLPHSRLDAGNPRRHGKPGAGQPGRLFSRGAVLTRPPEPPETTAMIIEHRTYTLPHGGMDAYLARYRELALPLQMRHLGRLLGFFVSDIGTLNQVLHIWAYDSMADREAAARAGGRSGLAGIQARQSRDLRGAAGVDLARGVVQSATGLARHGHVRFHAHQPIAAHAAGRRPGRLADRAPVRRPRDRPHRRDRRPGRAVRRPGAFPCRCNPPAASATPPARRA